MEIYFIFLILFYKQKLEPIERKIILCFFLWFVITMFSSFVNQNAKYMTILLDSFVCVKFMIYYLGGKILSRELRPIKKYVNSKIILFCKIISIMLILLCLHEIFMNPFFEKYDFRYFTNSLQLCFLHPTYFAAFCVSCVSILICNMKYNKNNFKYIVILSIVTCLTFRSKAIGAIFVIFAIYYSCVKYNLKLKTICLILACCIVVYFSMDQIEKYFTVGATVPIRLKMHQDGIKIAEQYFPFGSGFGTFGTTVAYESNSKFYYKLGYMSGYYKGQPVSDTFWPGIFAQSGWIGTIFFVTTISLMVFDSIKRLKENKYYGWAMLSILSYSIIASTSETAFFNPATAIMFIIYGIASDRKNDFD